MSYQRFKNPHDPWLKANSAKEANEQSLEPRNLAPIAVLAISQNREPEIEGASAEARRPTLAGEISPRDVLEMLRQERARGITQQHALDIVRGRLANDPRLAPEQQDTRSCLICSGPETEIAPLLPFLSSGLGGHRWLHSNCHPEHVRRQREKVDACLRAAGVLDGGSDGQS